MKVVIETERLLLREFNEHDGGLIFALNSDPDVTRYTCDPILDPETAKKVLDDVIRPQYELYNYGRWAVHIRQDLTFIGWCGFKFRKERNEIDLGYRFLKSAWGKGYATEAARASLCYGFRQMGFSRIIARALPANSASIRVLEKCGMQYLGEEFVDGHLHKTFEATQFPNPEI